MNLIIEGNENFNIIKNFIGSFENAKSLLGRQRITKSKTTQ